MTVTQLAELSNCSEACVSQVKHGTRPPSARLIQSTVGSGHYTKTKGAQVGKHAYFRAMRAFYRWLYSPRSGFNLESQTNPMTWVDAPKVPRRILPSLSK